jgi:hypothetical protein
LESSAITAWGQHVVASASTCVDVSSGLLGLRSRLGANTGPATATGSDRGSACRNNSCASTEPIWRGASHDESCLAESVEGQRGVADYSRHRTAQETTTFTAP